MSATWMKCECECHRSQCGSSFLLSIEEYERVRLEGNHFAVTPGHEHPDELVVRAESGYLVIAKQGEQGRIAESLDPRQ